MVVLNTGLMYERTTESLIGIELIPFLGAERLATVEAWVPSALPGKKKSENLSPKPFSFRTYFWNRVISGPTIGTTALSFRRSTPRSYVWFLDRNTFSANRRNRGSLPARQIFFLASRAEPETAMKNRCSHRLEAV